MFLKGTPTEIAISDAPQLTNEVLTIFCSRLGDVIQADGTQQNCPSWIAVPPGKDYMIATVSSLMLLSATCGKAKDGHFRLTDGLCLHQRSRYVFPESSMFEHVPITLRRTRPRIYFRAMNGCYQGSQALKAHHPKLDSTYTLTQKHYHNVSMIFPRFTVHVWRVSLMALSRMNIVT